MFYKVKNRIEKEIAGFLRSVDKDYSLRQVSPILSENIKEFVSRKGKRIRPVLFVMGYLGFAKKEKPGLYRSALAIELLHTFMLIHDDIIDKSRLRRGEPSMHEKLNHYLKNYKRVKFNGQDLAIVIGDVMYAIAIDAFLAIKENMQRKEEALRKFIQAAVYTGCGEFIELLVGLRNIEKVRKADIYKIYDYKTSFYTFSAPLSTGAILAGASNDQVNKLSTYGMYLGRAFQVKDDILGMFADEAEIGKSTLTDLQEGKKTLLMWHAYKNSNKKSKSLIKKIMSKKNVNKTDLLRIRRVIEDSGALEEARKEIYRLIVEADNLIASSKICPKYKKFLTEYPKQLLNI